MSKKNKTSDSKSQTKKIKDKDTTVFSSNEVTLFDLEENVENTNKKIDEHPEIPANAKNSNEEDITIKFKGSLTPVDISLPKQESVKQHIFAIP